MRLTTSLSKLRAAGCKIKRRTFDGRGPMRKLDTVFVGRAPTLAHLPFPPVDNLFHRNATPPR